MGDEETIPLGVDGNHLDYGPILIELIPEDHIFELSAPLPNLLFPVPGDYEMQLHSGDGPFDEPIRTYRFRAEEGRA